MLSVYVGFPLIVLLLFHDQETHTTPLIGKDAVFAASSGGSTSSGAFPAS